VKDGFRFMRESVDFLVLCDEGRDRGCGAGAGMTGTSWSLDEELRREASELLDGCEVSALCRRCEADEFEACTLIDSGDFERAVECFCDGMIGDGIGGGGRTCVCS
jgi:hypothetical protein